MNRYVSIFTYAHVYNIHIYVYITIQDQRQACLLCGCFSLFRTCTSSWFGPFVCESPRRCIAREGHTQDMRQRQ